MKKSQKIFYIQPYLVSYRQELVDMLSKTSNLTVLSDSSPKNSGFQDVASGEYEKIRCEIIPLLGGRLTYQKGVLNNIFIKRPDKILAAASVRDISFWLMLLVCKLLRIRVYAHGQGLYNKVSPSILRKMMYKLLVLFSDRYICYTDSVFSSLEEAGIDSRKLCVAANSIRFKIDGRNVKKTGSEIGVLYIGRLRKGCRLELLIDAVNDLNASGSKIELHIVGSGELEEEYKNLYGHDWIYWYGKIYDENQILEISKCCKIGCYPGDAGLSVVHYFSLRLPPVIHDRFHLHMGPEPSYVIDNLNGFLFDGTIGGLRQVLFHVFESQDDFYRMISDSAYETYTDITEPSFAERMYKVFNEDYAND